MPVGNISIERKVLYPDPHRHWSSKNRGSLCEFQVFNSSEDIKEHGEYLQVDFANKNLGGGALRGGCSQEQIFFMTYPELLVGMLICPTMGNDEAIEFVGAQCYSNYEGLGDTFVFVEKHDDVTPRDRLNRRKTRIVAMDALKCPGELQYTSISLLREAEKAYCAFMRSETERMIFDCSGTLRFESMIPVATGNWGCGAFGGDPEIKSMIQWIAASQAGRPKIMYSTFEDNRLDHLSEVVRCLKVNKVDIGKLWQALESYGREREFCRKGFFDWLLERLITSEAKAQCQNDLKGARERMRESRKFQLASEEEWILRKEELQRQALRAQKLRERKRAEEKKKLEVEAKVRQRVEDFRTQLQLNESTMGLKEQERERFLPRLKCLARTCPDMASFLRKLDITIEGGSNPTSSQVEAAIKRAKVKFHPDSVSKTSKGDEGDEGDVRRIVEAEETFKIIDSLRATLPFVSQASGYYH